MLKSPWTHEEVKQMLSNLEQEMKETEASQEEEVNGLPPMNVEECQDYLLRLGATAEKRVWTQREAFLHGQLLAQFQMAVTAEALGKKGRFYVISEDKINELRRAAS